MKRNFATLLRLSPEDLIAMQEYIQNQLNFVMNEMVGYPTFFTGTNLQVIQNSPAGMSVLVKAGYYFVEDVGIIWLEDDFVQTIDAAGVADRHDIISATYAEVNDETASRMFKNLTGNGFTASNFNQRTVRLATIHYTKNTSTVPTGHDGLSNVLVGAGVTSILTANCADIRAIKPFTDLTAHRTAAILDHAAGCIRDVAIYANANITLSKINGNSVDDLLTAIRMGFPNTDLTWTFAYDANYFVTSMTSSGDYIMSWTFTYDGNGNCTKARLTFGSIIFDTDLTWSAPTDTITSMREHRVA